MSEVRRAFTHVRLEYAISILDEDLAIEAAKAWAMDNGIQPQDTDQYPTTIEHAIEMAVDLFHGGDSLAGIEVSNETYDIDQITRVVVDDEAGRVKFSPALNVPTGRNMEVVLRHGPNGEVHVVSAYVANPDRTVL